MNYSRARLKRSLRESEKYEPNELDDDFNDFLEDKRKLSAEVQRAYAEESPNAFYRFDIDDNVNMGLVADIMDDLEKSVNDRRYLKFRMNGRVMEGVPMVMITPSKYVFKVDSSFVTVNLAEVKLL